MFIQVIDSSTSNLLALSITGNLKALVDKQELHVPVHKLWRDLKFRGPFNTFHVFFLWVVLLLSNSNALLLCLY